MGMDETIVAKIDDLDLGDDKSPALLILRGKMTGTFFDLNAEELVAGRSQECDIWIEDNTISRKHFKIKMIKKNGETEFYVQDLGSTNGTFVNSTRVEYAKLTNGDKIQISKDTIIQFDWFDRDQRLSNERLYEMGTKDPVTESYNKSFFLQRISDEFSFAQRQNSPLSILIFDIDFFKVINDTYGHLAGDKALQVISIEVQKMIRSEDIFCRYGGEEFVIIMRNTNCQAAVNLAERIRLKIESVRIPYEDKEIKCTISLGVSTLENKNFRDYPALIAEADKFLYQSKGNGRNRVSAVCIPKLS